MKVSPSKHPNYPWRAIWKEGTKWKNRFFKSERQAIAFSKRKAPQLRDVAPSDDPPTKEERAALDAAKKHGIPLMEAINHWRKTAGASSGMKFSEFVASRLKAAGKDATTERHKASTRRILAVAVATLGERLAVSITPADCLKVIETWSGSDSQRLAKSTIGSVFTHAIRMGWTQFNPAASLKLSSRRKSDGIAIFSPEEAAEWLCCVATRAESCLAGWSIAMFAGLRRAEIERLDWSEVNLERGYIEVTAGKSKTKSRRLIEILPNIAAILAPLAIESGPVFPKSPKRAEAWALQSYGRPLPKNIARHSFVSYHLALFGDLAATEIQAGHDREILFRHYREIVTPELAECYFTIHK